MIRLLERLRDQLVHHLQRTRHNPGGDDVTHRLAGLFDTLENTEESLECRWRFGEAHQSPGHHAEHALRADACAAQVVAANLLTTVRLDPQPLDAAVRQHHLVAKDMVGGDAVFQRMRAAGVCRNVAPNRASRLARRIRGIK